MNLLCLKCLLYANGNVKVDSWLYIYSAQEGKVESQTFCLVPPGTSSVHSFLLQEEIPISGRYLYLVNMSRKSGVHQIWLRHCRQLGLEMTSRLMCGYCSSNSVFSDSYSYFPSKSFRYAHFTSEFSFVLDPFRIRGLAIITLKILGSFLPHLNLHYCMRPL